MGGQKEREINVGIQKTPNTPKKSHGKSDKRGTHLPSTEPSICKTGDVEGKTSTDDQTRRLQHLRHT